MNKIMLDNKEFYYQVFFKKNKNIYLRIQADVIKVTAPKRYNIKDVEAFIQSHKEFVFNNINKAQKPLYSNDIFELWGKEFNLIRHDGKTLKIEESTVIMPNNFEQKKLEKFYKAQTVFLAKKIISEELILKMTEFDLKNIELKSQLMKSRFGSCNTRTKIIKLNSLLARFEPKYLRAVLIHEIVHLKLANHQKNFYDELFKFVPDYKLLRKELNKLTKSIKM
ncbi:MAG: DUF45 domain-containing protein [Candidatus Izemoplasmatales bacterium]|jgi:predicted metal-dependent hydrolase|nr:DUF45 domain-containing protein [Candidatus Izemoplasmatales bacterium]